MATWCSDHTVFDAPSGDLGPVCKPEFVARSLNVPFRGAFRDRQRARDLLVAEAPGQQRNDLPLTWTQASMADPDLHAMSAARGPSAAFADAIWASSCWRGYLSSGPAWPG